MENLNVVAYEESMGAYTMPEGAEERLRALSVSEQIKLFGVSYYSSHIPLEKCSDFKGVIVHNGIIVGVLFSDFACYPTPCFINESVCTWDAEDNNGAGYKTRTEYTKLLFLGEEQ